MSDLNTTCKNIVDDADAAMAAAVVDLETGLLLGVHHTVPYFSQSYLDAVAAAAVDQFRGKGVTGIEKLLSQQRGETVQHTIEEIQMSTANTYHFMSIIPGKPNFMAMLVTSKKANLGTGWTALRAALTEIAPNCP